MPPSRLAHSAGLTWQNGNAAAIVCCAPEPYEVRPVVVRVKTTSLPLTLH